ncbi:hypothetical protein B0T10DRAFT_557651 [Thelonectria olida]|uniref:Uncharacterized protein n=1 Tax=Thelonectria olida TaxID=1576542 RepID=A0A9P9ATP5_9HYPO|nr:hypothetical protein B0T10DRAFT_557651 [Thelonectria olida]
MSGLSSIFNIGSSSSSKKQANIMSTSQSVNAETASVMSSSSTSALLKNKPTQQPTAPAVDAKKLQEQALKSQVRFCM